MLRVVEMMHEFEVFREGGQVCVCIGTSRSDGFVGLGIDLPAALEDLAKGFRSEPRELETAAQTRLRKDLSAPSGVPDTRVVTPTHHKVHTSRPTVNETWLPLSHSPEGPLEETFTERPEVGGSEMETLFYIQRGGDERTTFKCVRSSPTREEWFQFVKAAD